jgi:hypothetical protein
LKNRSYPFKSTSATITADEVLKKLSDVLSSLKLTDGLEIKKRVSTLSDNIPLSAIKSTKKLQNIYNYLESL